MHPPVVVPDALRLSGLAALSGMPLHSGGDPNALSAAVALSAPAPGQQQGHRQHAAVPVAAAVPQAQGADASDPAAVDRGPVAVAAGRRRPAEQTAAPEPNAKRRRKPAANGQAPADAAADEKQQQEPSERRDAQATVAAPAGSDAAEGADAERGAAQGADPPRAAEPTEVDAADTAPMVRTQLFARSRCSKTT